MSAARRSIVTAACAVLAVVALGVRPWLSTGDHATRVVAVHGGGGDVPSNLLRVYIDLSAPMTPGAAYQNIHLVDDRRREVKDAFLELREELWSPDYRRLTLLFDPGRVKRGIRSNLEMGAPLVAGGHYHLVIDSSWRDGRNRPLIGGYAQELRVAGFDSVSPDPSRWSVSSPRRATHDSLGIQFGEPLDHALAMRLIAIVDSHGRRIDGRVTMSDDDRSWTFRPAAVWEPGAQLRVDPGLEDLAGNNLVRLFDTDRARGGRTAEDARADTSPRRMPVVMRGSCPPWAPRTPWYRC